MPFKISIVLSSAKPLVEMKNALEKSNFGNVEVVWLEYKPWCSNN